MKGVGEAEVWQVLQFGRVSGDHFLQLVEHTVPTSVREGPRRDLYLNPHKPHFQQHVIRHKPQHHS